jgi:hypothetical protein
MPCKATTALIALLVFGFPSVVLADINNRAGHHHLFVQRPVATMSNGHISRAVNDAAKPFTAEEGGRSPHHRSYRVLYSVAVAAPAERSLGSN